MKFVAALTACLLASANAYTAPLMATKVLKGKKAAKVRPYKPHYLTIPDVPPLYLLTPSSPTGRPQGSLRRSFLLRPGVGKRRSLDCPPLRNCPRYP